MAIARRGSVTSASPLGVAAWTVNKPTGVVSGDVIYVGAAMNAGVAARTFTIPTGFVLLKDQNNNNNVRTILWRKVADGSEGASFTFTIDTGTPSGQIGCIAYSGVDTTTPEDLATTGQSQTGTTPAQASQTTVTDNAVVLGWFGGLGFASSTTGTPGSSATEELDQWDASTQVMIYLESLVKTPAGATALTFTATNSPSVLWECDQVALRPAAAAGPAWDKVVIPIIAHEPEQIMYGTRWYSGYGSPPADWTAVPGSAQHGDGALPLLLSD